MPIDPYDLCPCHSGKKVKFCCLPVIDDMEKAATQIHHKNFRSAIKICQQIDKKQPGYPWPLILQAFALQQENNLNDAYELVKNSVMQMQDHPGVFAMFTSIHLKKMGYKESKKLVDRAIQLAIKHPEPMHVLPLIYNPLSMVIDEDEHLLAARYFLAVDISSCNQEMQQHLMQDLYEMDNHKEYPLSLRGPQFLKNWQNTDEASQQLFDRFMQTAGYGMLERAQAMLQKLIDSNPSDPVLWWNLGLIQAWDLREMEAVIALKKAAELFTDEHAAIEAYSLMIAIKWFSQANNGNRFVKVYRITGLSKLHTLINESKRIVVNKEPVNDENVDITMCWAMDREYKADEISPQASWRDYPTDIGQVHIVCERNKDGAEINRCWLLADDQVRLDQLDELVTATAGETITPDDQIGDAKDKLPLNNRRFIVDLQKIWNRRAVNIEIKRQADISMLFQEMEDRLTQDWINTPLEVLEGKSLIEAVELPEMKQLCLAILFVAETIVMLRPGVFDQVYQLLGLSRLPKLKLDQLTDPTHVSNYQLYNLDFTGLEQDTLNLINERVQILNDIATTIRVLQELFSKSQVSDLDKLAICLEMAKNNSKYHNVPEAHHWISQAEERLQTLETDSESRLKLDYGILSFYYNSLDPKIQQRISEFRQRYEIKFPEIKEIVHNMAHKIAQVMGETVPAEPTSAISSGLWTPDQQVPAAASSGGLWLPGS